MGILLSGRGSNFEALHRAVERGDVDADIALVASNVEGAPGIETARSLGLDTVVLPHAGLKRREHDLGVVEALRRADVHWVCLAGYLRVLSPAFVQAFPERIVNIHPSLLPSFPGLHAQQQAWDYGVRVSGCTVHLVDQGLDSGPIVAQEVVSVAGCGDSDELSARILEQEHVLYPRALARLLSETWRIQGRRVVFEREASRPDQDPAKKSSPHA
jgi:phosphoribosylglycinamide formyltransferase-1